MRYTVAVITALAVSSSAMAGVMNDWNLIVAEGFTSTSEVEGRAMIGGSFGGPASNYATKLLPRPSFLNIDTLIIGGAVTAQNVQVESGRARLGGSRGSASFQMNGGGTLTENDSGVASIISNAITEINAVSTFLKNLPTTAGSTVNIPGGQPGPLNFDVGAAVGTGVAVFNVNANQVFSNSNVQQLGINLRSASSIVINVSGASVLFNNGNFVDFFTTAFARANVLWNFHDATSIDLLGRQFNGAILAPKAHMTFQGVVEGSVFVKSLDQRGEVHLPGYTGIVPAPGAAAGLGLLGLVALRRRRA